LAERFHAPQGEGLYAGTQMAFVRTVGCSVGQGICTHCDTDFDRMYEHLGGGSYEPEEIAAWAKPCRHVCVTGGEPLDRDLRPLLAACGRDGMLCHVETSGTVHPQWLDPLEQPREQGTHAVGFAVEGEDRLAWKWTGLWVTVSPKPGFREDMVALADEVKLIVGGLGDGPGWPTVEDALRWAGEGKTVYVQPRNGKHHVNGENLREALGLVAQHPELRLSVQLHKFLATR
jgi:organic radical activating enzyme